MRKHAICAIFGGRAAGKSWLTLDLLTNTQTDTPCGIVCGSDAGIYAPIIPSIFCYDEPDTLDMVKKVVQRQQHLLMQRWETPCTDNSDDAFIVIDQCQFGKGAFRKDWVQSMFTTNRFLHLSVFATFQSLDAPAAMYNNFDYIFILSSQSISFGHYDGYLLYKEVGHMFPSYEAFRQILVECTRDHSCLVIDNTATGTTMSDRLFWYTASTPDYAQILCSKEAWLTGGPMNGPVSCDETIVRTICDAALVDGNLNILLECLPTHSYPNAAIIFTLIYLANSTKHDVRAAELAHGILCAHNVHDIDIPFTDPVSHLSAMVCKFGTDNMIHVFVKHGLLTAKGMATRILATGNIQLLHTALEHDPETFVNSLEHGLVTSATNGHIYVIDELLSHPITQEVAANLIKVEWVRVHTP